MKKNRPARVRVVRGNLFKIRYKNDGYTLRANRMRIAL